MVLEAVGPFLAGLKRDRLAALVRGLPDLGRLFAGLHLPPPEPLGDAALERTRLFQAVSRLIERVAAERPVALLVDDLPTPGARRKSWSRRASEPRKCTPTPRLPDISRPPWRLPAPTSLPWWRSCWSASAAPDRALASSRRP